MRMTRAALRAQEAEEELQTQMDNKLKEQGLSAQSSSDSSEPLIHEDVEDEENLDPTNTHRVDSEREQDTMRQALRDITSENYPTVEADSSLTENAAEVDTKGTKKGKSKKGRKAGAKRDVVVKEQVVGNTEEGDSETIAEAAQAIPETQVAIEEPREQMNTTTEPELSKDQSGPHLETSPVSQEICTENETEILDESTPGSQCTLASDEMRESVYTNTQQSQVKIRAPSEADVVVLHEDVIPKTPSKKAETVSGTVSKIVSKTPKFNPDIHLPAAQEPDVLSCETEDSFVDSIRTRSPSKFSQLASESQVHESSDPFISTPIRRTSSNGTTRASSVSPQRIEDSVEAIDALEDAIEKFAEDFSNIEALPFESPVRSRKTPARSPAKTPASKALAKTPSKTPVRTPAKTVVKTPARTPAKTPVKTSTPKARTPSFENNQLKTQQHLKDKTASEKRETVKDRVRAIETAPSIAPHRRATSVHALKKTPPEVKQTLKSRHMSTKSVPAISQPSAAAVSFSNSPVKTSTNQPKKRVTSGNVLVTSKPAFVPAKSTKTVTTSTFSLPGEAVAAKLKAQREERLKREASEPEKKVAFKARPAPARTARPSVMPRENKASTVRTSVRAASGENKENVAPARPVATTSKPSVPSIKATAAAPANATSVRRTTIAPKSNSTVESRKPTTAASTGPAPTSQRVVSLTSGQSTVVSKSEATQQRLKGKEVYGRIKGSIQQQEEEKKAKEEAARKARAEAAERGRQASREWAEKQKRKMALASGAKSEATDANANTNAVAVDVST